MSPSPIPKTKAQHLERVRQNQQRSRQRKRAHVARLEQEITQLRDESGPTSDISSEDRCPIQAHARLQRENDARRDLLLSLGVTVSAQELFIRNSIARPNRPGECPASLDGSDAVRLSGLEGPPSFGGEVERLGRCPDHFAHCHPSPASQPDRHAHSLPGLSSISSSVDPQLSKCPVARFLLPFLSNATNLAEGDALATAGRPDLSAIISQKVAKQTYNANATAHPSEQPLERSLPPVLPPFTPSQIVQPLLAPPPTDEEPAFSRVRPIHLTAAPLSLSNSSATQSSSNLLPISDYITSDGTTACKIAASLITTNNALGYSAEELESKLQVGYLVAGVGDEDCRILNRVLFAVLAEISWAPP